MLTVKAYAKLNLCLNIKGKRPDGYHEIEFINTELGLHDIITLEKSNKIEIICSDPLIPADESNFCYKAAKLLGKNVRIQIDKQIPNGGLGGGSADCAAVLNGINELYQLGYSEKELIGFAAQISTDACFSIVGGTALVKGKGEIIEQLADMAKIYVVVINPKICIKDKTKKMYSMADTGNMTHPNVEKMKDAILSQDIRKIISSAGNSFHSIRVPEYEKAFRIIKEINFMAYNSMLAGSGPLVVSLHETEYQAIEVFNKFKQEYEVILTHKK